MFAVFAGFERVIFTNREGCVQYIGIRGDAVCVWMEPTRKICELYRGGKVASRVRE